METFDALAKILTLSIIGGIGGAIVAAIHIVGRNALVDSPSSDAAAQIKGASESGKWRWPSDMHRSISGKARMKDLGVLQLVLFQKIYRDRTSVRPLLVSCATAHAVSALLIVIIVQHLFGLPAAFAVGMLFVTSAWAFQIILMGGYQGIAIFWILVAIWCLQISADSTLPLLFAFAAGAATCCAMFSSASARKLLPLVGMAFLWEYRDLLTIAHLDETALFGGALRLSGESIAFWAIAAFGLAFWMLVALTALFFGPIVRALFHRQDASGNVMLGRHATSLNEYLGRRRAVVISLAKGALMATAAVLLVAALARDARVPNLLCAMAAGGAVVALGLLAPNIWGNARAYIGYWGITKVHGHFRLYVDLFQRKGLEIPPDFHGAGWPWFPRIFLRFAPWTCAAALASAAYLGMIAARGDTPLIAGLNWLMLMLAAASPLIYGELTKGPQIGRSYYPALLGALLLIAAALHEWTASFDRVTTAQAAVVAIVLIGSIATSVHAVIRDIYPARMAISQLLSDLAARGISEFHTYTETPFGRTLLDAFPAEIHQRLTIKPMSRLEAVKSGVILIPPTSAKSLSFESVRDVIEAGDLNSDPGLMKLLKTRRLDDAALARIASFGTSRYWVHESEVTSFRDLILHDITEFDRYRAHIWLAEAATLQLQLAEAKCSEAIECS